MNEKQQEMMNKANAYFLRQECIWQMLKVCDFDATRLERFGPWIDAKERVPDADAGTVIVEASYPYCDDSDPNEETAYKTAFGCIPGIYDNESKEWTVAGDDLIETARWMAIPDPIPAEIVAAAQQHIDKMRSRVLASVLIEKPPCN